MLKASETGLRTFGNSLHCSNSSLRLALLQTEPKTTQKSPLRAQEQEGSGVGRGSRARAIPDSKGHRCVSTCGPGVHTSGGGGTPPETGVAASILKARQACLLICASTHDAK